jgi:hypothetical protein
MSVRRPTALGRVFSLCLAVSPWFGCGPEAAPAPASLGHTRQALSLGTVVWEKRTTSLPPARMGHALIYDSVRAVSVAAGGRPVNDAGVSLSDTWVWDGQSWASIAAGMPNRGFIAGAFDSKRGISLTYGGVNRPTFTPQYFSQILERGTGAWTLLSGFPGARSTTGLAYDEAREVTVLFGGFDGNNWHNDLFEWNGSFWIERCSDLPCRPVRPSVRESPVFVYDPARQVTLLFGGFGDYEPRDETWTWDGATWTQRLPPVSPSARYGCAAAYDPATQRIFVFGGITDEGEVDELWAWDGSTWEQLDQTMGPTRRRDARLAWDTARKRGVLFGGRAGTQAVDFWELSLAGNPCTTDDQCHRQVCSDGFCGGPPASPELDAGSAGQGGTSGGAPSGGSGGSGGAAGTSAENGGSESAPAGGGAAPTTITRDGGSPLSDAPAEPELPAAPTVQAASGRASFYGCAVKPGAGASAWLASGCLALLIALRRRRGVPEAKGGRRQR